MKHLVTYNASKHGYCVQTRDAEGDIIDEYMAGNNPVESTSTCPSGSLPVPFHTLLKWAREAAKETAESLGCEAIRDIDIEA